MKMRLFISVLLLSVFLFVSIVAKAQRATQMKGPLNFGLTADRLESDARGIVLAKKNNILQGKQFTFTDASQVIAGDQAKGRCEAFLEEKKKYYFTSLYGHVFLPDSLPMIKFGQQYYYSDDHGFGAKAKVQDAREVSKGKDITWYVKGCSLPTCVPIAIANSKINSKKKSGAKDSPQPEYYTFNACESQLVLEHKIGEKKIVELGTSCRLIVNNEIVLKEACSTEGFVPVWGFRSQNK
ncbi:MAG: hypothetical protein H7061_00105 [Bdellovibrionaceae bacterium]|nr:hypothetical protein [Bdellovibrio sp.]